MTDELAITEQENSAPAIAAAKTQKKNVLTVPFGLELSAASELCNFNDDARCIVLHQLFQQFQKVQPGILPF